MKKLVKNLLFGAGIAAVGLAVYSLWKDAEEPVVVQDTDIEPATTPSKEYVEHRKALIREKTAEQEMPQEEVCAPLLETAAPASQTTEPFSVK